MNNNCFDNKIKKILDCGKQCNCTPVIVGPTGPTGPQGPASIAVGVRCKHCGSIASGK